MKNSELQIHKNNFPTQSYIDPTYAVGQPSSYSDSDTFKQYLNVIRKRKWAVLFPNLIIVPLILIGIVLENPIYEATSILLIENSIPKIVPIQGVMTPDLSSVDYATEFELMKSRDIIGQVIDEIGLKKLYKKDQSLKKKLKDKVHKGFDQLSVYIKGLLKVDKDLKGLAAEEDITNGKDLRREKVLSALRESIIIRPRQETKLVEVKFQGNNPYLIAKVVNTLVDKYTQKNLDRKLQVNKKSYAWLKNEAGKLKIAMSIAEKRLQDFRYRNRITSFDFSERENSYIREINERNSMYLAAKDGRMEIESVINQLKTFSLDSDIPDSANQILEDKLIINLKNEYISLKSELADLMVTYTERHPRIIKIKSKINQIKNDVSLEISKLLRSLDIKYRYALSKERSIQDELQRYRNEIINLDSAMIEYASLKREAEMSREIYLSVSKRMREAELTEALEVNNVKIVQEASVPIFPMNSGHLIKIVFGIIVSLGVGLVYVFAMEYFDGRFRRLQEIESYLNIPVLGSIPHFDLDQYNVGSPITLERPGSVYAEEYKIIRTRISIFYSQSIKRLMVTSAYPNEGKSTTSSNLGVSFAQLGYRVLVMDVDLRNPSLHLHFGLPRGPGLVDVLVRGADWRTLPQETEMENLKVLPAGGIPPNPSELLSSQRMKHFMNDITEVFDLIVLDAPVILSIPDVEVLSSETDGVLFVHDSSKVDKEKIIEAKKILERVRSNIVGIVLNNVYSDQYMYYYNSYGNYYGSKDSDNNTYYPEVIDVDRADKV